MDRRCFLAAGLPLAFIAYFAQSSRAASLDAETIKAALNTATPEEDGFIEYVLAKVAEGVLPASLVESSFQWARRKPKHKFQYFKRALILQAARIGIRL